MKVALLADDHWGARGDSVIFADNLDTFYRETFWPYVDEFKIKDIIHLGDVFDKRKFVTFNTAHRLRRNFIEPLVQRNMHLTIVLGNHDLPFRHKLNPNGPRELFPTQDLRFNILDKPTHSNGVLFLPWICDENREQSLMLINHNPARVVIGHLELTGFEMYRGSVSDKGLPPADFTRFEAVYSGHFHHKSTKGNIHYLGATREQTWADVNDPKGFHVLDLDTLELEFIQNPHTVFSDIQFGDTGAVTGKIVRVVVPEGLDPSIVEMENFMTKVNTLKPLGLKLVDRRKKATGSNIEFSTNMLDMLMEAANEANDNLVEQDLLKGVLRELYEDARKLEVA